MPTVTTHRLDADTATLLFSWTDGVPEIVYFGGRLADDLDASAFVATRIPPRGNATLDTLAPVSMLPEPSLGFMGHPGLLSHGGVEDKYTNPAPFTFEALQEIENGVEFTCSDQTQNLSLTFTSRLDPKTGVAVFSANITNSGETIRTIDWLSAPAFPIPQSFCERISFHGRWCAEFSLDRQPITIGQDVVENRRGRTSKEAFPGLILLTPATNETAGPCIGVHFGWSGNHRRVLERMSSGASQLQFGTLFLPGECTLQQGETYQTPEIFVAHSDHGLNEMSGKFHHHVRQNIVRMPKPVKPRPVTVNTWEAVYYDHSIDHLKALADAAADIGAERYVLDDGWFVGRNDDTTSLGDWSPDPLKYPDGLHPVVDYVVDEKGLKFGLWVEPEMVNTKSSLYRDHPDWALQPQNREAITGRNQLVLDLANPAVPDYLYDCLSKLLTDYRISYLKWDMNRDSVEPADQNGKPSAVQQTRALYELIDRLRTDFPKVEIESCSSGGGRIDYEILKRTHRFWASDSNDAVERSRIQTGFSYFFPPEVMGAHIGPAWSHTSGRGLHAHFRALVASYGHMGLELDLTKITDEERQCFKQAIACFKRDRKIWHMGTFHRLTTVDENLYGAASVSPDKSSARLVVMQTDRPRSATPPCVQVPGLDPTKTYHVSLQTDREVAMRGSATFDNPLLDEGVFLNGNLVATVGIQLPVLYAQTGLALALEA